MYSPSIAGLQYKTFLVVASLGNILAWKVSFVSYEAAEQPCAKSAARSVVCLIFVLKDDGFKKGMEEMWKSFQHFL